MGKYLTTKIKTNIFVVEVSEFWLVYLSSMSCKLWRFWEVGKQWNGKLSLWYHNFAENLIFWYWFYKIILFSYVFTCSFVEERRTFYRLSLKYFKSLFMKQYCSFNSSRSFPLFTGLCDHCFDFCLILM